MQAIVLAGGFGTRLRSVVPDLPKPLAPVAGRPFLAILLEDLARHGFSSVVLSVGYRHELIEAEFGDRFAGLPLRYAVEDKPLGTGGAVRLALRQCTADEVFVLNGDSHVELDYAAMREAHHAASARITVCIAGVADAARYGSVRLHDGFLIGFSEKGAGGAGQINAGVYLLARNLLEGAELPEVFSFERDILAARIEQLHPLAFRAHAEFIDIGVPEDYARAQRLFARA